MFCAADDDFDFGVLVDLLKNQIFHCINVWPHTGLHYNGRIKQLYVSGLFFEF